MGARVAIEVLAAIEDAAAVASTDELSVLITFTDPTSASDFGCDGVSVRQRFERISCVAAGLDPTALLAAASQPGVELIELDGQITI